MAGPPKKAPKNVLPGYNHLIPNQTDDNYKPAYNVSGMCNYEDSLRPIHLIPMPPVAPPRERDNSKELAKQVRLKEVMDSYKNYNPADYTEEKLRLTPAYIAKKKQLENKE